MATQRFPKRFASLKKSRKYRDRSRQERTSKRLHLEPLEDRRLMALVPPVILPNSGVLLNDGDVMTVAPKDLNFEFNDILDPVTIANGIRLTRSGKDGVFDPPNTAGSNDVVIVPGFIGLGDDSRQVVMRFSTPLVDDVYRIEVVGAGATPLRDSSGAAFNGGEDFTVDFRLDLGAQIIAVVPQPVRRLPSGQLSMTDANNVSTQNKIVVYFNDDDLVDGPQGAENPAFYKLSVTHNTLDPADDIVYQPTQVVYDPVSDTAVLTFGDRASFELFHANNMRDPSKSFRLRIGTTESRRDSTTTVRLGAGDPGSSFAGALNIGSIITAGAQGASAQYAQTILDSSNVLQWPGDGTDPGHRDIPAEDHYRFGPGDGPGIETRFYNFQSVIGSIPDGIGGSQPAFNLITENQKERAREIFELYGRYSGVQFVETANSGLTIATGDLRALDPLIPTGPGGVIGLAGLSLAIMDNAEVWNDQYGRSNSPPGFSWFDTAMHEIGHLLGLGHSYDLPAHTVQGEDGILRFLANDTPSAPSEDVFPGDADIVHMRNLYRPESKDIDMYKFTLDSTGVFTAETFAERLPNSSNLDTHIAVYREDASGNRELIARNDDYFSEDSFIKLNLGPGTYYVGVSASGNHYFDPTIDDSGIGGTTQGDYEVKFDFRKTAGASLVDEVTPANPTTTPEVLDTQNVAFDGDADGAPGGVYNFWFRAAAPRGTELAGKARTLFVDRAAPGGGNGSLATPFNEIDLAIAAALPDDIIRIVGNGGADGNVQTLSDNLAYEVGFSNLGGDLRDGRSLNVPKDVTVMIDAGAIFHMFRSYVSVGSTAPSIAADRSGGALQVLGTPTSRVYFTTNNEGAGGIGLDLNSSTAPKDEGDWGGLAFTTELDRADGRFLHEEVGVFLNYVNHADIRWGGGQVNVDSNFEVVNPISMTDARPTITHNIITRSADAAMSANPDSFEETNFQAPRYWTSFSGSPAYSPSGVGSPAPSRSFTLDYQRVGPQIHGNILVEANTANIAVAGVTTNTSSTARSSATLSHTVPAGNDRLLVVSIMTDGNTDVSSVTYGGVALTQALENDSGAGTGSAVEIWYLTSPAVGVANVVVNFAGSVDPSAVTATNFTGVNQSNPIGVTASATAATGTAIAATLTTTSPNSVLFGAVSAQGGTSAPFTPGAGVTEQWDLTTGANLTDDIGAWGGTLAVPAIGSATFAATSSLSDDWALGVIEIRKLALIGNSTNALFIRTTTPAGDVLEELTVSGRFDDTDIVHVIQENLHPRGTPSGATLEQVAPPVELVVPTSLKVTPNSGPGFAIGTNVEYKVVYVDLLGNEGLASATINVTVTDPDLGDPSDTHAHIQLENLTIPSGDFVGRRLYRRIGGAGEFSLVDLLPAQLTTFVDQNQPRSGELQLLRVRATPSNIQRARLDGSLVIDPAIIVKSDGARIDLGVGANLLAEGVDGLPVVFTSLYDDRYGAGGTFDTPQDNADDLPKSPAPGDWGGIFAGPNSKASIDFAVIAYAGGLNRIEGTFAGFNAVEVHQADARVAHTEFEFNADGSGGQAPADRFGRGANAPGIIFVRGAQPVIIENIVHDNEAAFINVNVNALNSERVVDAGRQIGSHFNAANLLVGRMIGRLDNNGPLVRDNRLVDNAVNGLIVRGGTLTTEVVMDDTDIVHVVFDGINVPDFHSFGGLRLESSPTESLVVKFSGDTAGITATGRPLEIDDRIGGILHVLGQPGFPVVLTAFSDDSAGAGFTPNGFPQVDTNGDGTSSGPGGGGGTLPPPPPATGELQVTLNTNATQLVNAMLLVPAPTGVTISNATYVGANTAAGTYINGDQVPLEIYPTGIILTTGNAVLPVSNTVPDFAARNNLAGDADLDVLAGTQTEDATVLTITIDVAAGSGINSGSFDFHFGSEEFSEFVGSPFNDVLGAFINGGASTNVIRDSQGNLVTINSGFFDIDNEADVIDIEYDGMTSGLTARFPLQIGTNVLKIAIADAFDDDYDSGALITNLRFSSADVGTGGVGAVPVAGEWQGLTIDQWAHDRNVETILELESPTSDGSGNATPSRAQPLGSLGPFEKSGDETLRLGFTVHGVVGQPSDVDVYSFSAKAGTEIWVDLDRTWHALDPVVELIDNLGNVLARSQNSTFENLNNGSPGNIARRMQKTPPYEGVDYYTTNYRDPGMRLVLPGPANSTNTYHVRIRSAAGAQVTSATGGAFIAGSELVTGGPTTVNTVTQGSTGVNEVQEVPHVLGAQNVVGSFTLTFNGQTTGLLPVNATNAQIQSALEALSNIAPGDVAVTGTVSSLVEFRGAFAGQNVNPMTMGINEVQLISIAGAGLPGSFTLSFGAETTAPISYAATAAEVQAALEALSAFAPGDIFVTRLNDLGGSFRFAFEFRGPFANQNVGTLISASTSPNEFQRIDLLGAPAGGTFTLTFNGQTTAPIAFNATAADVQAALAALSSINGAANVAVTGPAGGSWDVEFRGIFAGTNVPTITVNTDALVGGLTDGAYQAQIRLREVDEFGGSTVRFANIRYAENGIRVLGQPTHSPLAGEHTDRDNTGGNNDVAANRQELGNLLNSDRGMLSVAGNLSGPGDADFYRLQVQYDGTQGTSDEQWWSTIFDIDYADGFARPNAVISVFDEATGNLVYSSRDSNIADDRPIPTNVADVSDLTRGSSGAADPWIGPVELRVGTYLVVVSGDSIMPTQLEQYFFANAANTLVRMEPMDTVQRAVEDHIGSTGGSNIAVETTGFIDLSVNTSTSSIVPWSLHDVTLFVTQDSGPISNDRTLLRTIDPFSGSVETTIAEMPVNIGDIAMHPRGRLYTYRTQLENSGIVGMRDSLVGNYFQIDTGTGGVTQLGDDSIQTYMQDPTATTPSPVIALDLGNPLGRVGEGVHFRAMGIGWFPSNGFTPEYLGLAVGGRDVVTGEGNDFPNILYSFNPDNGVAGPPPLRSGAALLSGAMTDVVERGILDTAIDSVPPIGGANAIQVDEATIVDPITGATLFNILDNYPPGGFPPEVPNGTNEPTEFRLRSTFAPPGTGTLFEFTAGPEARIDINPTQPNQQIRDGNRLTIDGTNVEFDTGDVIVVTGAGNTTNYPVGSSISITDVDPDPTGPGTRAPITYVFEFSATGVPTIPNVTGTIAINGSPSAIIMAQRIRDAINAVPGISIRAATPSAAPTRISLTNDVAAFPGIDPNTDGSAQEGSDPTFVDVPGLNIFGDSGVPVGSVRVRIEETSLQAELLPAFELVNDDPANPNDPFDPNMPFNTTLGVSGPAGNPNRVIIGFDGNRLNASGATSINQTGLTAQIYRAINQALPQPVGFGAQAVPFLAQDGPAEIANRMAQAIVAAGFLATPTPTGVLIDSPGIIVDFTDAPLQSAAQAPGGTITGMAIMGQSGPVYLVSDTGGLFRLAGSRLDYINSATDLVGIEFAALTAGPRNVEGERYRDILFGIDTDGELFAFNLAGELQPIFASTTDAGGNIVVPTSVQTGLTNVNGLAFSNLDYNLFHTTPNRANDAGHGIVVPHDQSRVAAPGGTSIYFGFESVQRNNVNDDQHFAAAAGLNSYNLPGGAHGSIETNNFSLLGYSSADNPVLYFNYFLDTEGAGHNPNTPVFMRDSFRVFVSGDDGVWHLVGTNNGNRFAGASDDEFDYAPLRVQETWDSTGGWRQARIPLGNFAGRDNLRLRFDFSTAGSMNVGDYTHLNGIANTPTNGDELRPVEGHFLRDQHQFTVGVGGENRTFEFDLGYTLIAPNGAAIPDGARFTVDGITFEFDSNSSVVQTPTLRSVPYTALSTSGQVADAIRTAILAIGASPVQPVIGNRVNLRGGGPGAVTGALSVTLSGPALPPNFIEGAPGVVGGTRIDVHSGMSRSEVFRAMVPVMANVLTEGDPTLIKTHNEVIKLIGYRWVGQTAGPFADPIHQEVLGITTALPGDEFGAFNVSGDPNPTGPNFPGALRGRTNAFEGLYIDDIIIGVAERGEMVTNGNNVTTFANNPRVLASTITEGDYQLEIRRSAEGGVPNTSPPPLLALLPQIHTNDRLREGRMLDAPIGAQIYDTQTFSLSDGINTLTFEFNDITLVPASGVAPGNVRIDYRPSDTAPTIAQRVVRAVNSAPVQAVLKLAAQMGDGTIVPATGALPLPSTSDRVHLIGAVNIPNTGGLNFVVFDEQYGDRNQFRDQGQIILYGNEVSNAAQWGILIDNGARSAADGNTPHPGSARVLRENNTERLVPGVVVTNNVVHRNGTGGILFSGDGGIDATVPFGRIVNNTLYGNGGSLTGGSQTDVGIRVNNGASPTLMNNIIANFNLGVDVSANSLTTVLGGTLFQGNDTNSNVGLGGPGDFPITLANNEPLFVNAAVGNFYLAAQSRAIDSSVDSLLDRPALVTVKNPMGIAVSPIISPDRDGVGQLRVDDPSVATPNGFGLNPFKDRGAIDRVDFNGPNSILINPQDNDSLGVDLDPAPTVVVLKSQILQNFTIRLIDRFDPDGPAEGSDIDDTTVDTSKVRVEVLTSSGPVLQVEGVNYTFSYDTTNNIIRLTPLGGLWPLVQTYRITLDNSAATGIADKAGNILAPNQPDGTHIYTIFLGSAVDFGDLPDSFGTLRVSNGPTHQIVGGIHLGATNGAEADGQPSAAADLDGSDDGVTFGNLQPGGAPGSSDITVVSSAVGKLDAWFDLNQNGGFEANEYILQGVDLVVGSNLINFTLPTGARGDTYARFRMTTTGFNSPLGNAPDGEVEDYLVTLVGPEFQNGTLNVDVDNDGFVSPIDALLVINYLFAWLPIVQGNGFSNIPLPPREPEFDAPVPVLDPTGGGVPGNGRFIDVNGDGVLTPVDALLVINYLNNPPTPAPLPEGEGEGESPEALLAAAPPTAGGPSQLSALGSAALLVSPDIVIEERTVSATNSSQTLLAATQLSGDESLDLTNLAANRLQEEERGQLLRLTDRLDEEMPFGPLDDAAWSDLLDDLAADSARNQGNS